MKTTRTGTGMIGWVSRSLRRRGSAGFTLIELLVVIVILGILAAVVVFAVRGSGDKGRGAAIATDERIIRTAMETYCAQKGHYPTGPNPMQTLVDEKFLSSLSTYHSLSTGDDIASFPQGKCAAAPTHYKLEGPGNGNGAPNNGTCTDPPATWRSHLFCPTGSRTGGVTDSQLRSPLQLPDGRVMAILHPVPAYVEGQYNDCGSLRIELYSPNTGQWAAGPEGHCGLANNVYTGDFTGGHVSMALIRNAAGPCGPNCGKVLIYTDNSYFSVWERWYLYDPDPSAPVVLKEITPSGAGRPTSYEELSLLQITGPNCGSHCGQILIAGAEPAAQPFGGNPPPPAYRVFDPTNTDPPNAFQPVTRAPFPATGFAPILVGLADGKILAFGMAYDTLAHAMAEVINPSDLSITPAAPPAHQYAFTTLGATGSRLATNEVLATGYLPQTQGNSSGDVTTADIFDPGAGTWRTVPKCSPLPETGDGCFGLTAVGNKVLAKTGPNQFYQQYSQGKMYLFDPGTKGSAGTWEQLSEAPDVPIGWAVPLTGSKCNPYCGKVLVVGAPGQPAYLFTP